MTKTVIIILIFFYIGGGSLDGQILNGLYTNEQNEFICFNEDSLSFKIDTESPFKTQHIGIGSYQFRRNKVRFDNLIGWVSSAMTLVSSKHQTTMVQLVYSDNQPIWSAHVDVRIEGDGERKIRYVSNDKGIVELDIENINWAEAEFIIEVFALDFYTIHKVKLKQGGKYLIKSVLPGYTSFYKPMKKRWFKMKKNGTESIQLKTSYNKVIFLRRVGSCNCLEALQLSTNFNHNYK